MPDLLLELACEEIPARMQQIAANDLQRLVTEGLVERGLTYEAARGYCTPRRLALDVRGVSKRSADVTQERKGPRTNAPAGAVDGFLRSAGLDSADQAEIRSDSKKGDYYVAILTSAGRDAEAIIGELIPHIIRAFPWPKSMRWGRASAKPGSLRWVRPLTSILCTFGPETEEPTVISFETGSLKSSNITRGHRFMAPDAIKVRRFEDYSARLEEAFVVLDANRRKDIIRTDARNLAFANGLELIEDEGLLDEVAGLVEWPVVLMSEFDEEFLQIPAEVIRLTIRTNQKCFVCRPIDSSGSENPTLSNRFILVANIEARDGGTEISAGNARVVQARLSDAAYFWKTDQADLSDMDQLVSSARRFDLDLDRPLDQRMARLDHLDVTFHAKLGTQGDRVERIAQLAGAIGPLVGALPDLAVRASVLAKADLMTEIVGEFPELQGFMGQRYALLQDEDPSVASAIAEHYRPQGPGDEVPVNKVSISVALADKLDMLSGFWAIGEKPTGSKDPYALRRAALGVIRIILENRLSLRLGDLLALRAGEPHLEEDACRDLILFFHDRLKVYLRDSGARHDLIDAVLSDDADDLLIIVNKISALADFLETENGKNLLAGTRRAANIVSAEKNGGPASHLDDIDPDSFVLTEERNLYEAVNHARKAASDAISRNEYTLALRALADLRDPIDTFFDNIMVNAPDPAVRAGRLALLAAVGESTGAVADFSKIVG